MRRQTEDYYCGIPIPLFPRDDLRVTGPCPQKTRNGRYPAISRLSRLWPQATLCSVTDPAAETESSIGGKRLVLIASHRTSEYRPPSRPLQFPPCNPHHNRQDDLARSSRTQEVPHARPYVFLEDRPCEPVAQSLTSLTVKPMAPFFAAGMSESPDER